MPRFLIGLNSHSFANKFDLKLVDIRLNTLYDSVAERVIKDPACLWGLGRKRESGGGRSSGDVLRRGCGRASRWGGEGSSRLNNRQGGRFACPCSCYQKENGKEICKIKDEVGEERHFFLQMRSSIRTTDSFSSPCRMDKVICF